MKTTKILRLLCSMAMGLLASCADKRETTTTTTSSNPTGSTGTRDVTIVDDVHGQKIPVSKTSRP